MGVSDTTCSARSGPGGIVTVLRGPSTFPGSLALEGCDAKRSGTVALHGCDFAAAMSPFSHHTPLTMHLRTHVGFLHEPMLSEKQPCGVPIGLEG